MSRMVIHEANPRHTQYLHTGAAYLQNTVIDQSTKDNSKQIFTKNVTPSVTEAATTSHSISPRFSNYVSIRIFRMARGISASICVIGLIFSGGRLSTRNCTIL